MKQDSSTFLSWRTGVIVGALAFGLMYLPTALAADKYKLCDEDQTKMCDAKGKPTCAKTKEVAKKEAKGFYIPPGGGNSPCPNEGASPT